MHDGDLHGVDSPLMGPGPGGTAPPLDQEAQHQLRRIKSDLDPDNLIRSNQPVY